MNRGVPDFRFEDSLVVQEIALCEHGIRFLFFAEQDENLHLAALMFPDPDADGCAERFGD